MVLTAKFVKVLLILALRLTFSQLNVFIICEISFDNDESISADSNSGYFFKESVSSISGSSIVTNISTTVGKTVHLNCSLARDYLFSNSQVDYIEKYSMTNNKQYTRFKQFPARNALFENQQQEPTSSTVTLSTRNKAPAFNPTWLKADVIYNQYGSPEGYKTENIIVTRKGIIADVYRDRMKLISLGEKMQVLKINDVDVRDEGKYICREFSSRIDRTFYLSVYSPIRELSIKFNSASKFFREVFSGNTRETYETNEVEKKQSPPKLQQAETYESNLAFGANTVSIKENDELVITCTVNSSKPAANLSIWMLKRENRHVLGGVGGASDDAKNEISTSSDDYFDINDLRKLDIVDSYVVKNKYLTVKSVATSKLIVSRNDNQRFVSCVAENANLNEKWESKRLLNVLYGPKCSKYQKVIFNTGINQTIDLECHMAEANPPYLDFTWNFFNNQAVKERMRSNGFISRISWTPRSERDFGEISCVASNGLDLGECKMQLELGGAPNPPYDCYHKENNKTIIIECKPGFDQGDPEVYFYLLKRKSNGVLVEYARKRDSCSFLISNLILEEYMNDFFIYSSNKFGSNREKATKLMIENRDFLLKNSNKLEEMSMQTNKQISYIIGIAIIAVLGFVFACCLIMRCRRVPSSRHSSGSNGSLKNYTNGGSMMMPFDYGHRSMMANGGTLNNRNSVHFQEPAYKYSAHNSQYSSKASIHYADSKNRIANQHENCLDDKEEYFNASESTSSGEQYEKDNMNGVYDNSSFKKSYSKLNNEKNEKSIRSPSLINNIQDLDMSPRSKKKCLEKEKEAYSCSRSLIDETTETDSENYVEFSKAKQKADKLFDVLKDDFDLQKYDYQNLTNKTNPSNNFNSLKTSSTTTSKNAVWLLPKVNVWYGNNNNNTTLDDNNECDDYSGISVDKPVLPPPPLPNVLRLDYMVENSTAIKSADYKSFKHPNSRLLTNGYANGVGKPLHNNIFIDKSSINEYIDEDSSDSTNTTKEDENKNNKSSLFKWQKANKLISNETISLDVDDEKLEGILV